MPRRSPYAVCRYSRKKCTWKDDHAEACDRCLWMEIECRLSDDKHRIDLYMTDDDNTELQTRQATIEQLDSDMKQLQQNVAQLWRQSCLEWKLRVVNGVLQLETPIRTIEELTMFGQASVQYLSPFSGFFMKQPIRFESTSITISLGLSSVIQRHVLVNPRKNRFDMLDPNYSMNLAELSTYNHRAVIDRLVMLYLEHYNPYRGLLHRATFLEHYYSTDDPMDSPLILAVCINALFVLRLRINYTPYEISMLAEMFYIRCRNLLFDIYDEPTKRLDVVITTSFIFQYISSILVDHLEADRLISEAFLACSDLAKRRNELTPVQQVLLQRNHFNILLHSQPYTSLCEDDTNFLFPAPMGGVEVLEDEPIITKTSIYLVNEVLHFFESPYISSLLSKVNYICNDQPCEILIEDILQYEPMVRSWWSSLPSWCRICNDPFDPDGYKLVKGKVLARYLGPFTTVHVVTGMITSSILRPTIAPRSESNATVKAVKVLRRKLISLALNSCKVIVYSLRENWTPGVNDLPNFGPTVMKYGIYCLEKFASCKDIQFPSELLGMMKKRLESKSNSLIPAGHEVPLSSSLLTLYRQNLQWSSFEVYEQYPLPGFAMLSDTLFSSVNRLAEQYLNVSTNICHYPM